MGVVAYYAAQFHHGLLEFVDTSTGVCHFQHNSREQPVAPKTNKLLTTDCFSNLTLSIWSDIILLWLVLQVNIS